MTLRVFHGIKQHINLFTETAFSLTTICVDELIRGYIKQCYKFDKYTKTWVLFFILNIHKRESSPASSAT